jgi:hypothetical protein
MEALQIREFLERVLPWPSPEDDGVISLHTSPHFKGVAVRTIDEFMKELDEAREENENIYFCTSQTTGAKPNGHDKLVPSRKKVNVALCKSIFFDLDAKDYPSAQATTLALKKFLAESGLPPPSAIVASGSGGYHVYWTSLTPLIQGVWQQYADGLRALTEKHGLITDAGCTTDSVRILRVPGTLNYKNKPAKPVWQVGELGPTYDFSTALASLAEVKSVAKAPRSRIASGGLPAIPARFAGRQVGELGAGIQDRGPLIVPPLPAIMGCPFLKRNFKTGGDGTPEPQWYQAIRCATYMEGGEKIAHALSKGDDRYKPAETDEKWQHALEAQEQGLGWPSCAKIKGEGAKECNGCPHFALGKSPLNLALVEKKAQLVKANDPDDWRLPEGYRLKDGHIEKRIEPKKKKDDDHDNDDPDDVVDPWFPFIKNEIIGRPWAQKNPDGIMLTIRIDVATTREVFVASTDCPRTKIIQKMCEAGIWFNNHIQAMHYEGFFMDWIGLMNAQVAANEKANFGWEWHDPESKLPTAFVYGGSRYKNDGTKEQVGAIDHQMREEYYPVGKRDAWDAASKVIFDQKRPALELIVAATLAGPLVQFTRVEGCMLSVHSNSSGAHKSTASKLGAAIFGHPVNSRESKGTSAKGALKRAGDLQHLTIAFDDLQDDKDLLTASMVALQLAQGHEGNKLTQGRGYAAKGKWQTLSLTLSNQSIVDFIIRKEPNTAAPLNRIFEVFHSKQANDDPGMIDEGLATRLIGDLNRNFGHVGREYASMLACNVKEIDELVETEQAAFRATIVERGIEGDSANRYWMFTCTVLLAATKLGQELGIPFDYDGIRELLVDSFLKNSSKRSDEAVDGESIQNTELAVSEFLNSIQASNVLWTDNVAQRGGHEDKVVSFGSPPTGRSAWVHFSTKRRIVRISQKEFKAMLREEKRNPRVVMEGLKKFFNADLDHRYILGAGTEFAGIPEKVIEIPIPVGSPLETMMFAHGGKADEQL